jgi:TonB-linked SusC/RagA family outer membrane protein
MKKNKPFGELFCSSLKKTLLIMRIAVILMILGILQARASDAYSQKTRLSVNFSETELVKVLDKIEDESEFFFLYNEKLLDTERKVSISENDQLINVILNDLFAGTDVKYSIIDRKIILAPEYLTEVPVPQQKSVSGTITDENGNPLPGVNITLEGTTVGSLSDIKGKYSINLSTQSAVIVFSFVGYNTQKVTADGKTPVNIQMIPSAMNLDEVVVVGYGTQKRKDLTGAFAQVKSADLTKTTVVGFDQALQGKMAGVQVTNNSGEPGGSRSIRIRGVGSINSSNEPLYIIDGVPYGDLNAINVNDIDRIDVLKDAASASIYGSRASNGVILVTTKRAAKGFAVSFDAFAGVQSVGKKIKLLNGQQFAELANENLVNGGIPANPMWSSPSTVQNNDWQSALFEPAPMQNYNLNISGGGDKVTTMFSFGYLNQGGIIIGSNYKRYTARLNTDFNISKRVKAGIIINGSFAQKKNISSGGDMSAINAALYMAPTTPVTTGQEGLFGLNPDGSQDPNGNSFDGYDGYVYHTRFSNVNYFPQNVNNPVGISDKYLKDINSAQDVLTSSYLELEVITGLKIRSTINLTYSNGLGENGRKAAPDALNLMAQLNSTPTYNQGWSKSNQWNWVNTIAYTRAFGKHNVSAIAGIDALQSSSTFVNINTTGAPEDQQSVSASNIDTRVTSGYPSDYGLLSYFGRASYDYEGKYLISGTIRRDGSSNFGPNNKYGLFSSVSAGWRISQENFMQSIEFINDLKLRASYGTVGNQNIPPFKYLSTYTNDAGTYQYTFGPDKSVFSAIYQNNFGDPNIHWEKSTQMDFGFDLSVMKSKLSFTFDYYKKKMEDLLGYFPVPAYTGVFGATLLKNGFSMENSGVELAVDFRESIGEVNFSVGANFAYLDNKVTKLTDNQGAYVTQSISLTSHDGGAITQTIVGGRIGNFLGYETAGIAQTDAQAAAAPLGGLFAGDRLYRDVNNDTIINASDKVSLGNGLPKYTFGFDLKADYKGFDIVAYFHGQAGVQIANMLHGAIYDMRYHNSTGIVNVSSDLLNRWTGEGTSNTMPRNAYDAPTSNDWFSNVYIENGSFLRLSNLQIGYSLPQSLLSKAGISYLRFYVAGQNLLTITKYTGYDPEVGSPGQNVLQTGADFGRYPLARMYSLGVNMKF